MSGKPTNLTVCLLLLMLLAGCKANNQGPQNTSSANTMKTSDEAAGKVIASLPQLITETNYKAMGFGSLDEVKSAQLGSPVSRRIISYQRLLEYVPGTPLAALFTNEEQLVYPIVVGDAVKTTALIGKRGSDWRINAVGDGYLASFFSAAVEKGAALQIVSIPGLNLDFVATQSGDEWTLIPVQDNPDLKLTRGRGLRATDALIEISNYAKEFDKRYGEQLRKRKLVE